MATTGSAAKLQEIDQLIEGKDYAKAESELKSILNKAYESDSELREHERALTTLGSLYKIQKYGLLVSCLTLENLMNSPHSSKIRGPLCPDLQRARPRNWSER